MVRSARNYYSIITDPIALKDMDEKYRKSAWSVSGWCAGSGGGGFVVQITGMLSIQRHNPYAPSNHARTRAQRM